MELGSGGNSHFGGRLTVKLQDSQLKPSRTLNDYFGWVLTLYLTPKAPDSKTNTPSFIGNPLNTMFLPATVRSHMPIAFALVLILTGLFAQWVGRASPGNSSSDLSGYVDLVRWGKQQHFDAHWNAPVGELTLSNRWSQWVFKADSKRADLDGGQLLLCFASRIKNGSLHISQLDVERSLRPLLSPPRLSPGKQIRTIAIGAGHGGKDPGKQSGKRQEKDYTLRLALELEQQLLTAGFKVIQIRRSDEFVDLLDRPAIARRKGADVYVSLHYNSFSGPGSETAKGAETYCLTPAGASSTNDPDGHGGMPRMPANRFDSENLYLAWEIQRSIVSQTGVDDRGVRRARYLELTQMPIPAVLIEGGFMTHPDDAALIWSAESRTQLAEAIRDGLLAYKRTLERESP